MNRTLVLFIKQPGPLVCERSCVLMQSIAKKTSRRRKRGCAKIAQQLKQKYGITRKQLDMIISELCEQYQCQWSVIATVLYREHQIVLNESTIKDRYTIYLDPSLQKMNFTPDEEKKLIKLFFLEGRKFKELRKQFRNRDRYSIKSVLEKHLRRAIKKLEQYLKEELVQMHGKELIGEGQMNKVQLLRAIISDAKVQWKLNTSTYKLLFYFMIAQPQDISKIPKDLGVLLYKRLVQIKNQAGQLKREKFNRIDPQYHPSVLKYNRTEMISKKQAFKSQVQRQSQGETANLQDLLDEPFLKDEYEVDKISLESITN